MPRIKRFSLLHSGRRQGSKFEIQGDSKKLSTEKRKKDFFLSCECGNRKEISATINIKSNIENRIAEND